MQHCATQSHTKMTVHVILNAMSLIARVTRRVCEKIAQNVAQLIFFANLSA
jgi:hypothetical protein